jgi:hypothetical protein
MKDDAHAVRRVTGHRGRQSRLRLSYVALRNVGEARLGSHVHRPCSLQCGGDLWFAMVPV